MSRCRVVGVVLFEGFELLDVFGPLEMFGMLADSFRIQLLSLDQPTVQSAQGPRSLADQSIEAIGAVDIVLVPGGEGVRREITNPAFLGALSGLAERAEWVSSVCTGSALLAATGMLDGIRATSNKEEFEWVSNQRDRVTWQPRARWVEDGRYFTASGVSAGMDMALAMIAKLEGEKAALQVAQWAEYQWHRDAAIDPFAVNLEN